MNENLKVAIRIKPLKDLSYVFDVLDNKIICQKTNKSYEFDECFNQYQSTCQVYEIFVKSLIETALKGMNGSVFLYGSQDSGKTYTLIGETQDSQLNYESGLIYYSIEDLLENIQVDYEKTYQITISFIMIQNDHIYDLLADQENNLQIQEDSVKQDFYIKGLTIQKVNSLEEILKALAQGQKMELDKSNKIFRIHIKSFKNKRIQQYREQNKKELNVNNDNILVLSSDLDTKIQQSQLNFVDLQGSEKLEDNLQNFEIYQKNNSNSHEMTQDEKEEQFQQKSLKQKLNQENIINKNLFHFKQVIYSRSQQNQYIPYRNSSITKILKTGLSESARAFIILCINESNYEECIQTLKFGNLSRKVQNQIQENEICYNSTLNVNYPVEYFRKEVKRLNSIVSTNKSSNKDIIKCIKPSQLQRHNQQLIQQLSDLQNQKEQQDKNMGYLQKQNQKLNKMLEKMDGNNKLMMLQQENQSLQNQMSQIKYSSQQSEQNLIQKQKQIKNDYQQLIDSNDNFNQQIIKLQQQNQKLQKQNMNQQEKLDYLQNVNKQLNQQIDDYKHQQLDNKNKFKNMNQDRVKKSNNQELQDCYKQIENQNNLINNLNQKINQIESQNETKIYNLEIQKLKRQLDNEIANNSIKNNKLSKLEIQINNYQLQNQQYYQQNQKYYNQILSLQSMELQSNESLITNQDNTLFTKYYLQKIYLSQYIKSQQIHNKHNLSLIQQLQLQHDQDQQDHLIIIQQLQQYKQDQQNLITDLQSNNNIQNQHLKDLIQQQNIDQELLIQQISELQDQIKELKQDKEQLNLDKEQLKQDQIKEFKQDKEQLQDQIQQLKQDKQQLQDQIQQSNIKIQQSNIKIQQLQDQIQQQQQQDQIQQQQDQQQQQQVQQYKSLLIGQQYLFQTYIKSISNRNNQQMKQQQNDQIQQIQQQNIFLIEQQQQQNVYNRQLIDRIKVMRQQVIVLQNRQYLNRLYKKGQLNIQQQLGQDHQSIIQLKQQIKQLQYNQNEILNKYKQDYKELQQQYEDDEQTQKMIDLQDQFINQIDNYKQLNQVQQKNQLIKQEIEQEQQSIKNNLNKTYYQMFMENKELINEINIQSNIISLLESQKLDINNQNIRYQVQIEKLKQSQDELERLKTQIQENPQIEIENLQHQNIELQQRINILNQSKLSNIQINDKIIIEQQHWNNVGILFYQNQHLNYKKYFNPNWQQLIYDFQGKFAFDAYQQLKDKFDSYQSNMEYFKQQFKSVYQMIYDQIVEYQQIMKEQLQQQDKQDEKQEMMERDIQIYKELKMEILQDNELNQIQNHIDKLTIKYNQELEQRKNQGHDQKSRMQQLIHQNLNEYHHIEKQPYTQIDLKILLNNIQKLNKISLFVQKVDIKPYNVIQEWDKNNFQKLQQTILKLEYRKKPTFQKRMSLI